tara:strand:- start:254 stop:613 length:360 start_codon:yes stop_codon:yes gene_type:complete
MTTITTSLSYLSSADYNQLDNPAPIEQIWAVRHDRSELVRCHNMSSARAIAEGRAPSKVEVQPQRTLKVKAFVSPTGQYYVMHGNQRMDVANAQTARHYVKNGVAIETMLEASLSLLNQ